jgi:hypothetical protein
VANGVVTAFEIGLAAQLCSLVLDIPVGQHHLSRLMRDESSGLLWI